MGRKELTAKNAGSLNLREVAARATLRKVWQEGHVYVELRPVAKRSIFFCTLCLTQCFSEDVLYAHLKGNLHTKRYASAKLTLLLPNPWPFNDGVLFFNNPNNNDLTVSADGRSGTTGIEDGIPSKLRCSSSQGCADTSCNDFIFGRKNNVLGKSNDHETVRRCRGVQGHLTIPYVWHCEEDSCLELNIIGYGHIDAKFVEDGEESSNKIGKIWCAWLGDGNSDDCDDLLTSQKCDFAIVNLSYTYDLGKKCAIRDENRPTSPDSFLQMDESGNRMKRRKKSFSDSEDSSYCNLVQNLRKQKSSSAERNCDICRQRLLLGKDVATLFNLKTGRFACSSRNINGAFHLFHVSCLVHWVLLCEFELWVKQNMDVRGIRGRKKKASMKNSHFSSIFCPECQGTGTIIEGDALEKPTVPLSETFLFKLRVSNAQKTWMKAPETLQKCSTGLCFPSETPMELQGKVMPARLLLFYRAGE